MRVPAVVRFAIILCCAAGSVRAADFGLQRYENPQAVATDQGIHLFARAVGPQEASCLCYHQAGAGEWQKLAEFRAEYSCVAWGDGRLYLFLPNSVIELGAACKKTGEADWVYKWRAQSAVVRDGVLTAFGVGDWNGRFYAAWARIAPLPGADRPGSTSAPASVQAPGNQSFLVGEWGLRELPLEGQGRGRRIRAALDGDRLWLFWTAECVRSGKEELHAGLLEDSGTAETAMLATLTAPAGLAACVVDGRPLVVYGTLPARLAGATPLSYRFRKDGGWPAYQLVPALGTALTEHARSLSAVSSGGKAYLFIGTEYRVIGSVFDGVGWSPAGKVLSDRWLDRLFEFLPVILGAMAAAVLVLVASAVRARFKPRRAMIASIEYHVAGWFRRAGAYVTDLILVWTATNLIVALFGFGGDELHRLMATFFCLELLYFSASETRIGKTAGKHIFGLIVVSRNGGYPTWAEALLRNLPRALIDSLAVLFIGLPALGWLVGSVVMLNMRGSQRVGDVLAGTFVVRERGPGY